MPQHFEKRILPYSAAQMFDLVAAVDRYPDFLPWCHAARVEKEDIGHFKADLQVGPKALCETFTSIVTLNSPYQIRVESGGGPLSYLENVWTFEPLSPQSCEVSFFIDFRMKSRLFGSMMDLFFDSAFRRMVGAFEARAKDLFG